MSDKQKGNLGDQILKAVDDILENGNFNKLNSVVSDTVSKALDEVSKQLSQVASGQGSQTKSGQVYGAGRFTQAAYNKQPETYKAMSVPRVKMKKVGRVSGVLLRIFGGIGTGVFGFLFLLELVPTGAAYDFESIIFYVCFVSIFALLLHHGMSKHSRLKRAQRYIQLMDGKAYINFGDLALLTNKSEVYVRKDVWKMIDKGIFPEGHIDVQEKCLIMGDAAYREYIRLEKSRRALQTEMEEQESKAEAEKEARKATDIKATKGFAEAAPQEVNAELQAMIQEGNECIRQLRDLNDAIEGEVISQKLFKLENLLKEIFEQVKEHPEQMPEMHKFMDYYLPTTLKLVKAYEEFDHVSVQGEDIRAAKCEIEKTLDTINMAFAELLNKLFRDRAFDATTDAQVLKTMLAKEGLTREPIFANKDDIEETKSMQMQKEYK